MLRPTFYSFETAKRALASSQLGLDTVGHNISNVNTPGYTRQRIDQVTFNIASYKAKYAAYGYTMPGQGSEVNAITQIRDPYLDKRYRTEAAKAGEQSTVSDGLAKINLIFDEIQKTGNHAKMGEFLTQLDALIASAGSAEQATVLRAKAEDMARVLNKNSIDLENAAIQQMEEMQNSINSINLLVEQIADLNVKIKEDHFYGNPSNDNNDLRNLLIDQLSELIDIDVHHIPQKVAGDIVIDNVKITVKGSKDPEIVLVNSGDYNALKAKFTSTQDPPPVGKDANKYDYLDKVSYHLVDGMTGLEIPLKWPKPDPTNPSQTVIALDSNITSRIFTGALKGHLDILNGQGTFAEVGENSFRGIPYTQKALDDYAQKLADTLNKLNRQQVICQNCGVNEEFFIDRPLFTRNDIPADANDAYYFTNPDGYLVDIGGTATNIRYSAGMRFDATSGNLLDANGNVLGVIGSFERQNNPIDAGIKGITARNIAISPQWAKSPQYIDTTAKNDALFAESGTGALCLRNEAGGPPISIGFIHGQVKSISSDGYLLNENGEYLCFDSTTSSSYVTLNQDDPNLVNIADLQRAMTESDHVDPDPNRPYYFANENGYLVINDSGNDIVTNIVYNDGMRFNGAGDLVDADGKGIEYDGTLITQSMLVRQKDAINYAKGEPTPNHLLPGANANDNLDQMKIKLTAKDISFSNGYKGSFQEYMVSFQEDMANDKETNDSLLSGTLNVLGGLADSRDGISAVSVDEEGINMMTFQNYYNAAARYLTVLDEALGTIIQGMGVVGR